MEDAYAYYVLILGISEDVFWNSDVAFLRAVADNKNAYDAWMQAERDTERMKAERSHGKGKKRG